MNALWHNYTFEIQPTTHTLRNHKKHFTESIVCTHLIDFIIHLDGGSPMSKVQFTNEFWFFWTGLKMTPNCAISRGPPRWEERVCTWVQIVSITNSCNDVRSLVVCEGAFLIERDDTRRTLLDSHFCQGCWESTPSWPISFINSWKKAPFILCCFLVYCSTLLVTKSML
jgi:hypothetical protein